MAKKKETESSELTISDFTERISAEVTKEYGKNIFKSAQDIIDRPTKIINWSHSLDGILNGGVTDGSWLCISGPPKHGKTSIILNLAASAQKQGFCIYYLNIEARLKKMNLKGIKGLELGPDKFRIVESTSEKTLTSQDYLTIAEKILRTHHGSFIILDSVSSLVDAKVFDNGLGTKMMGSHNQAVSQFIDLVCQLVPPTKSIVVGVAQDYANVTGYGKSYKEKIATKFIYQADISLRINKFDKWFMGSGENEKAIGQILHVEAKTTSLGNPFGTCETYLRFNHGIDNIYELMKCGEACGLIGKSGSWYTMDYLAELPEYTKNGKVFQFQGGDNLWEYLNSEPKALEILEQKVKEINV